MSASETPRLKMTIDLTEAVVPVIRSEIALAFERYERHDNGWMDTSEAATWLSVPRSRIYDLVSLGHLTPARDGTRLKFKRSDLDTYMGKSV